MKEKLKAKTTSLYRIGYVYAGLDDRQEAYRWFDQTLREHDFFLADIHQDPSDFAAWRSDPHFQQLLKGMNLVK